MGNGVESSAIGALIFQDRFWFRGVFLRIASCAEVIHPVSQFDLDRVLDKYIAQVSNSVLTTYGLLDLRCRFLGRIYSTSRLLGLILSSVLGCPDVCEVALYKICVIAIRR